MFAPTSAEPVWPHVSQFILGPTFADHLLGWQHVNVADRFKLTLHPALPCTQARNGARELTLLGNLLDPMAPEATNADILQVLLDNYRTRESLIDAMYDSVGRMLAMRALSAAESGDWVPLARLVYSGSGYGPSTTVSDFAYYAASCADRPRCFIEATHALIPGSVPSRAVARKPPNEEAATALVRMRFAAFAEPPMPFLTKLDMPRFRSELLPERTNLVRALRAS